MVDQAGNQGPLSTSRSFILDTVAPLQTVTISGISDNVGRIQGTVSNGGDTDDNSLSLSGSLSSSLATNDSVRVYDGVTFLGTSTVTGNSWTFIDSRILVHGQVVSYTALVADATGNFAPASTPYTAMVDTTVPTVTAVALTAASGAQNNRLNAGDGVIVSVNLSEVVFVTGTPSLGLNINGSIVQAGFSGGSGTSVLTFSYTIQPGQNDADGISIDASSLRLNGGSIRDRAGIDANLLHAAIGSNPSYLVDSSEPVFTSGGSAAVNENEPAGTVVYTATCSDSSAVTFSLAGTDASAFAIDAVSGALSIKASPDFETRTSYSVSILATDAAGNTATQAVVVSVTDVPEGPVGALTLLSSNPADDATQFEISQDLRLEFSEAVQAGSGLLKIYRGDGELVESFDLTNSPRIRFSGSTLSINPTWWLQSSTPHYVRIDEGAIRDLEGNAFAGILDNTSLSFQTGVETSNNDAEEFTLDAFAGTSSEAIGDHRMLFIRTTYADQLNAPWAESVWLDDMAALDSFWARNSYGKMHVSTTFTPLITLAQTTDWMRNLDTGDGYAGFATDRGNNNAAPWNFGIATALQLGYVRANYQGIAVGNNDWTRGGASWGGGDFIFNGWTGLSLIAHEGGHEIGLGHANWLDASGSVSEYGNDFDVMGNGGDSTAHYGLSAKLSKGWLAANRVLTNPASGIYRIDAHDRGVQLNDHLYGFTISAGGQTYTFEHRALTPQGRISDSLLIVRQSGNALVDATPDTVNVKVDAGIDIGRTWHVPGSDIFVTVLSQGDGFLDVAVQNGPFPGNVAPSASFTASASQVMAHDSVTFTATASDANGDGLVYFWWFSDGVVGSGPICTRSFTQTAAATVTARLTVSDLRGGSSVVETGIAVGTAATSMPVTVGTLTPFANSRPLLSLTAADAFAQEGGSDGAVVVISRQGTDLSAPLVVNLAYGGTGLADVSESLRSLTVTIAAGQTSVALPLSMLDDAMVESDEQLTVSLVSDAAYDISSANASATITLLDNDRTLVSVEAIDRIASEIGRDSGAFRISRSGSTGSALKVYYSPYGSAFNGVDYQALNGEITIAAGQRSVVVMVQALDDGYGEPTEQLSLLLASFSTDYDVDPRAYTATVDILDNDRPQLAVYSYANTGEGGAEGTFVIEAQGRVGDTVTALYTLSGTATAGSDYRAPSGSATISIGANGRGTATVAIPVLEDTTVEAAEVVRLSLSESSAYQLDDDRSAALVISDNDGSGPVVMVSAYADTPREGGTDVTSEQRSGQGRFYIQRSTTTGALTVNYVLSGSATAGSDYTGLTSGSVTIADGAPGAVVRFTPVDDALGEGSESVILTLTPDIAYGLGVVSEAVLRIGDNDTAASTVGFETAQSRISESHDPLSNVRDVAVILSAAAASPVSVRAVVSGGTALGDNIDWTFLDPATNAPIQTPTLTFAPGETRKLLRLRVNPDRHSEASEWSQIMLIDPTGATLSSGASTHRLDIDDLPSGGDAANRYIRLLSTGSVLRESAGSDPLLMVTLDRPTGSTPITVDLQRSGSASQGADYDLPLATLTFQPGEISKSIPLTLLNDGLPETVENLRIALVNASGAIITGPSAHEVVLVDSEAPVVQTATGRLASGLAAGSVVTTVTASAAPGRSISQWQILAGNAIRNGESAPAFSINADGQVLLSNPGSLPLGPTAMQLVVRATDNLGAASDGVVNLEVNGLRVLSETRWSGRTAFDTQDWSATPVYSGLLSSSATASGVADNFSRRIVGLFEPSSTGVHTFWVAGDDDTRLYLGSDEGEGSRQLIASVEGWTNVQQWDKYASQQSAPITLQAGQRYWLEVQNREGSGGDHAEVAWQGPAMAAKVLITAANLGSRVPGASVEPLKAAATYKAAVEIASLNATIGTDTGLTPTISSGERTRDNTLQLSGSADPGATVQLFIGTTLLGSASVNGGAWGFTTPALADGSHSLVAQVRDPAGNIRITAPVQAVVNTALQIGPNQLLSHTSAAGNLSSSGSVGSVDRVLSGGDGIVLFLSGDAGQYGNAGVAFSDGNTTTQDLILADARTGVQQLINRGFASPTTSSNQAVTLGGVSVDGRSVVFASSAVTSFGDNNTAFTDGNSTISGTSDLFVYDRSTSRVKLATWSGSQTNSLSRNASFVGLSADSRTLVLRSDYVQKIGSFSRSGPADTTASADLVAYDLASGAQTLLSHGAGNATQSLGAGLGSTVLLTNDGQYALFTANDVSKLGNAGNAFSDSAPTSADLIAARLSDGQLRLLSGSAGVSAGAAVTLLGQSADGAYAVFSAADASRFGFSDPASAATDLFSVEIATGTIRPLNHPAGTLTATTSGAATFLQVVGNNVYFSVADATTLGASADADITKADLYRANLISGEVQLLSFQKNNPTAAMNGGVVANSLVVSSDNRYVAFAYGVPAGTSSGGLTFNQGGDGLFVVDTQARSIQLANWSGNQNQGSYGFWAGARPKAFAAGNRSLIYESSYLSWTGSGLSGSGQYDKGILSFDLASGSLTLLSHSPASGSKTQGAASVYRGISPDGQSVFFTAADARRFGNDGIAFGDAAITADDLFAVSVSSGVIELVSGLQGTSLGTAVTFDGISESGQVFYRNANVQGLPAGAGLIGDAAPASVDLVATRFALLDLEVSGDMAGGADGTSTDNVTSARSFTLSARLLPDQAVVLVDNGIAVSGGAATADSQGLVSWSLSEVTLGTHRYSLLDHIEQIPVVMSGRPTASSLEVTVRDSGASMLLASSMSADPLTNANLESGTGPSLAKSQNGADSITAYSPLVARATGPSAEAEVVDLRVVPEIPTAELSPSSSSSILFPYGEPDLSCLNLCNNLRGESLFYNT
ncbi:MAG: Calx-beta domain-containing protein [Cyanobacteriota bacterium]